MSKWLAGFLKESKISVTVENSYIVFHIFNPFRDCANSFSSYIATFSIELCIEKQVY